MIKISGFEELQNELTQAQSALEQLDGELGSVSYDPNDPISIDSAICEMERIVDERVGKYSGNSIIEPMIEELKESYRDRILEQAAEARTHKG